MFPFTLMQMPGNLEETKQTKELLKLLTPQPSNLKRELREQLLPLGPRLRSLDTHKPLLKNNIPHFLSFGKTCGLLVIVDQNSIITILPLSFSATAHFSNIFLKHDCLPQHREGSGMIHCAHKTAVIIIMVVSDEEWKRPESEIQAEQSETSSRFCRLLSRVFILEELRLQHLPLTCSLTSLKERETSECSRVLSSPSSDQKRISLHRKQRKCMDVFSDTGLKLL